MHVIFQTPIEDHRLGGGKAVEISCIGNVKINDQEPSVAF